MSWTAPSGAIVLDMWRSVLNMEAMLPWMYVGMLLMATGRIPGGILPAAIHQAQHPPVELFQQFQEALGGARAEVVVTEVDTNHLYAVPYSTEA